MDRTDSPVPDAPRRGYASPLIDALRRNGHVLTLDGLTLLAAARFGFCWGVDKAVEIVEDALETYPGRRIWLVNQMIHNPAVNRDLIRRGIRFIKGAYADGGGFEAVRAEDVAVIPAFSSSVDEVKRLEAIGCTVIDTTCPWVLKPHLRTKRNIEAGFTTVIHATLGHDETRATCSLVVHEKGRYLVVRDEAEAGVLCDYLTGAIDGEALLAGLGAGASPGFDPGRDLGKIALINQTTMLASESRAIGAMIRRAVADRYGEDDLKDRFRDFDTICNATQDNQDAMVALVEEGRLDLMLVVGGFGSSNTRNLARIAWKKIPTYHIEDAEDLGLRRIRYRRVDGDEPVETSDWLPAEGPLRVGFTAGASTPDTKLAEVMVRLAALRGVDLEAAIADGSALAGAGGSGNRPGSPV